MEFSDPLSMAVGIACAYFAEDGFEPGWAELSIYRLLTGGGWCVSHSRATFIFDDEMKAVMA